MAKEAKKSRTANDSAHVLIEANRSGEWIPAEELREAALAACKNGADMTINLGGIDHLDASALQILLAFDMEQKKQKRHLSLTNASPKLRQWFEYAGAAEYFFPNGATQS
jgi:anti-anti-sigma regulatory factor